MALLSDNIVIQFVTSQTFTDLAKPAAIIFIIGFMLYLELKPRIKKSDRVRI